MRNLIKTDRNRIKSTEMQFIRIYCWKSHRLQSIKKEHENNFFPPISVTLLFIDSIEFQSL